MHKILLLWAYDPLLYLLARKVVLEICHIVFPYRIHTEINDTYVLCREISLHMMEVVV
jgi:hypothetical protein